MTKHMDAMLKARRRFRMIPPGCMLPAVRGGGDEQLLVKRRARG